METRKNSTELMPCDHLVSITRGVARGQLGDHPVLIPEPRFLISEGRMMGVHLVGVRCSWGLHWFIHINLYDQ